MNSLDSFLLTAGRTLAQMALYSPEHPTVKDAVDEAYRHLSSALNEIDEISISSNETRLLVNGRVPENVPDAALRPFLQLLSAHDLHSLSFLRGIETREMVPFFRLAAGGEIKKMDTDAATYLTNQRVTHVKLNQARYAKISEEEVVSKFPGDGPGTSSLRDEFQKLSLTDMVRSLVDRAVVDPSDRGFLYDRAVSLIRQQVDGAVGKVVTEHKREKLRLTNERERTEIVIGEMADGIVVVDDEGRVLMMNPAAEHLYGVRLGERLGKPLWEGIHEQQMMTLAKDIALPTDRPVTHEVEVVGSQDTQKTLRASSAAVQDTSGRVIGMVSVLSDVTKQKELNRLQTEFMANVTHDLRAPIHTVKLAVASILEGSAGVTTPEQQKMLSVANRNVDRLSRLIDDLLDFSKIESGKMDIRPQVMEIAPLLREAAASMDSWAKNRGVEIFFEEKKDFPLLYADSDRVLQVVNNLLSNAIKFTPSSGKIFLRMDTIEEKGKPMIIVEVEDSGPGISKDDQERIFQRFVQLKSQAKTDIRGTGLGLSICQALVELHKGRLWVQSPPPGGLTGSMFAFTLPCVQRDALLPDLESSEPAPRKRFWKRLFSRAGVVALMMLGWSALQARPYSGTVRRVLDPLTIQLEDGTRVRYLGLIAPEIGSPYYTEAESANRSWVENKEVTLEYGLEERDEQGRWIAYVYVDGVFVNAELIKQGLDLVSPMPNEEDVLPELLAAEREAHEAKRGQWSDTEIDSFPVRVQKKLHPTPKNKTPNNPPAPTSTPVPVVPTPAPAPAATPSPAASPTSTGAVPANAPAVPETPLPAPAAAPAPAATSVPTDLTPGAAPVYVNPSASAPGPSNPTSAPLLPSPPAALPPAPPISSPGATSGQPHQ